MSIEARLRISLSTGEFEVEGSDAFVAKYDEITRQLLSRASGSSRCTPAAGHERELCCGTNQRAGQRRQRLARIRRSCPQVAQERDRNRPDFGRRPLRGDE